MTYLPEEPNYDNFLKGSSNARRYHEECEANHANYVDGPATVQLARWGNEKASYREAN